MYSNVQEQTDWRGRSLIWLIGLVLGGWLAVWMASAGMLLTELVWGIFIIFKRYEQSGVFGLLTLLEIANFMLINGLITTFLLGGA
jgi:hypothetical protein